MAPPDLSSVPVSPRPRPTTQSQAPPSNTTSPSLSRRVSQVMGPPPIPVNSPPSNAGVPAAAAPGDNTGVGVGPGPLRHPRPMTTADLHLVLEKEQEAVVNRLTRELSLLRQQTASVASTASSTSTGFNEPIDALHTSQYLSGSIHPTSSRRHRSSSSLSSPMPTGSTALAASVASIAPSRDTALPPSRPSGEYARVVRSREPSVTSPRQSISPMQPYSDHILSPGQSQAPANRSPISQSQSAAVPPENPHSRSVSSVAASTRYEEAAHHKAEFEAMQRENEMLRSRVRDLEQSLKAYRDVQNQDESTTSTSSLVAGMRDTTIEETP